MAEVSTFYQSKYTGEQLDEILKNVYDAVPLDGSEPMTGALDIKKVENGYSRFNKNHTQTTDLGTELKDISKGGSVVALLLKAADQAARLQFGTSVYDLIHTGNITGYVKPYADAAQAASEAAESALEGVREAIEAIPEGAATPIVNDLTTGGTSMALSAEMGKELKTELDTRVNPNILDNWYFSNPVNQRGQTEYTTVGYTIDRWRLTNYNGSVRFDNLGMHVTGGEAGAVNPVQYIPDFIQYAGKTMTMSCIADGELYQRTFIVPESLPATATTFGYIETPNGGMWTRGSTENMHVQLRGNEGLTQTYLAMKLELGTQQTLAHQDASGKWVLNEIPNYAEELAKCQRYYQLFSSEATRPTALADYRPSMRVTPTTGTIDIDGVTYYYADANL